MQLRKGWPGLVAAVVAVAVLAAPARAGDTVTTTAVFENSANDGPGVHRYFGDVTVDGSQKCLRDRKVDFYRKVDGPDELIGRTRTDSFGSWSISIPLKVFGEGTVYVRVLRKALRNGTVCLPAKSNDHIQI
jgi:hypothetical protein